MVEKHFSYDPWGKDRDPLTGADDPSRIYPFAPADSPTSRGFSDHEKLPGTGLINMNARLYDPEIGRMLSADSYTPTVYYSQVLNRYSYVDNNPLSFIDPTGHSKLSKFLHRALGPLYGPIVSIITFAIGWELGHIIGPSLASAAGITSQVGTAAVSVFVSGAITGGISGGKAFKNALYGGLEAEANFGIHMLKIGPLGFNSDGSARDFLQALESRGLHGMVGGLMSSVRGDNFLSGFLAAGLTDNPYADCHCFRISDLVGRSVMGGFASVLGGGKFANGATTSAFAYLYNELAFYLKAEVSAGLQFGIKAKFLHQGISARIDVLTSRFGLEVDGVDFRPYAKATRGWTGTAGLGMGKLGFNFSEIHTREAALFNNDRLSAQIDELTESDLFKYTKTKERTFWGLELGGSFLIGIDIKIGLIEK